jgi:UDP:flavonoid glycosyltransferase YjiC (YdhE family)
VGRTCDLAILNAGHGSTLSMLLAGKPVLLAPIYLEQCMTTRSVVQLGAGLGAAPDRPDQIAQQLETLLASGRFTEAAQRFARRYRDWNSATRMDQMAARVEEVLEGATGSPERTCVQRVPSLQEPDWSLPAPSA